MSFEKKIEQLYLKLPSAPVPLGAYVSCVKIDSYCLTSGQMPFWNNELKYKGKVGKDLSEKEAYEASKICALNCLSVIKNIVGSLDNVVKIIKITGYVNSAPGFNQQPKVLNGASDLISEIFGDAGKHARVAVGASELPYDAAVELEMIVKVKST